MLDHINLYARDTIEIVPLGDMYAVTLRFELVAEPPSAERGGRGVTQLYRAAEVHDCIRRCGLAGPHANSVAARRVAANRIDQTRPGFAEVFREIESKVDPVRFPHEKALSTLVREIAARRIRYGESRNQVDTFTVHAIGPFLHEARRCAAAVYDLLRKGEHTFPTETTLFL